MDWLSFTLITTLIKIVGLCFVAILGLVSYTVYAERRVSAIIQDRVGPNRVGWAGLIQPIADGVKLLLKENFVPGGVNKFFFSIAPSLAMIPAILVLAVLPFGSSTWRTVTWPQLEPATHLNRRVVVCWRAFQ